MTIFVKKLVSNEDDSLDDSLDDNLDVTVLMTLS